MKLKPLKSGSGAFYAIWLGNGLCLFYSAQSPHGGYTVQVGLIVPLYRCEVVVCYGQTLWYTIRHVVHWSSSLAKSDWCVVCGPWWCHWTICHLVAGDFYSGSMMQCHLNRRPV